MTHEPPVVDGDQWYTPEIKPHSLEKIRLHNRYAGIFAAAMRKKWKQLAYIGLYSGAGHARVSDSGKIVETSALAVMRQSTAFTHYIFVDNNQRCIDALEQRSKPFADKFSVKIIKADVNKSAQLVRAALPSYSKERTLLSFCFIDPFDLQLHFDTIRALAALRMDFLVLLMLGVDARRNWKQYIDNKDSTRIADLLDDPDWRDSVTPRDEPVQFMLSRFDAAMQRLGYLSAAEDAHLVRLAGKNVLQYALAFYSQHELGRKFWKDTRSGVSEQLGFL